MRRNFVYISASSVLLAAISLPVSWHLYEVNPMSDNISPNLARPMCMGRYVLDIPFSMDIAVKSTLISGWRVNTDVEDSDNEFDDEISAKEVELANEKNMRDLRSLESVVPFSFDGRRGKIFTYDRRWTYGFSFGKRVESEMVALIAFVRIGKITFKFHKPSADEEDIKDLLKIIERIKTRDGEIPNEPGFCIESGLILDPRPGEPIESIAITAGLRSNEDISLLFSSSAGSLPRDSLLERIHNSKVRKIHPNRFMPIFHGAREINGILGEEASDKVWEINGTRTHKFMWEAKGKKDDVMHPSLTVELTIGNSKGMPPVNSSLSDEEVRLLWQKISSSLKLRDTTALSELKQTHYATSNINLVKAGNECPLTGWWNCGVKTDHYEVVGGASQFFRRGMLMPQAQLFGPVTLLDKMKNHRPTFKLSTPTVWILVKEHP
ncbi:hypothetical protein IP91_05034 [Pseudoduganella lurida]|uniref:Tle cognate immunity protein 4 C-terminal domain-containing protein n=1 Tax=Pseudoduganella lurida TaxID=1036180 RepID=A0A562QWV9_9BURK|nr:T6SS immunity protein Tli4 family protein [Pseudoduganella lurida]TWI60626.1 hypothetical protein IP91_05034 [Pseudoduganella lurida]